MHRPLNDSEFKEFLIFHLIKGAMDDIQSRGVQSSNPTIEKMQPVFTKYADTIVDLYTEYRSKIAKAGLYAHKDVAYPLGSFLAQRWTTTDTPVLDDDQPRSTILQAMHAHIGDDTFNAIFRVAPDDPAITAHITMGVYDEWRKFKVHELYDAVEYWGSLTGLVLSAAESVPVIADIWNKHTDRLDDVLIITDLAQQFGENYARDGLSCKPSAQDVLKKTLKSMLNSDEFLAVYSEADDKNSKSTKHAF